ncbi:MAG: hypothetical protein EOP83_05840, partial [Verrucomicrobiaceae bacterium]
SVQANSTTNTGIAAYTISSGSLPWGVTMNSTTGALSGTISLVEQDEAPVVIGAPVFSTPLTADLGTFDEGMGFNATFSAQPSAPGTSITTYALRSGSIPWGLALDVKTGLLIGTLANMEQTLDAVVTGTPPVWQTTSGSLGTYANTASVNMNVLAFLSNATITYVVQKGTLPWGLILNPTSGAITGTLNATDDANKTFSFTIRALTNTGGFADRLFSLTVQ